MSRIPSCPIFCRQFADRKFVRITENIATMVAGLLFTVGILVIIHAGYSSYESHQLISTLNSSVVHETMYGLVLIIAAALFSIKNDPFYTIDGRATTPEDGILDDINVNDPVNLGHQYLKPIDIKDAVDIVEKVGVNDYQELISRVEFIDVAKKRAEYKKWEETRSSI